MNKYIPYNITCPLASCSRSNTCARYANYQKAKSEEASFMVLNTDLLQVEGEGCPYHLVSERQRWARGFIRLCKSIPSGNAKYLNVYTPFTQRRFYKARNGEFPLNPQMQADLLEIFKERGAASPIVQITGSLTDTIIAHGKDKLRSSECLTSLQLFKKKIAFRSL